MRHVAMRFVVAWMTHSKGMVGGMLTVVIGGAILLAVGLGFLASVAASAQQNTQEDRYICYESAASTQVISKSSYCKRGAGTTFSNALDGGKVFTTSAEIAPRPDGTTNGLTRASTSFTTSAGNTNADAASKWAAWAPSLDAQSRNLTGLLTLLFVVILVVMAVGVFRYFQSR